MLGIVSCRRGKVSGRVTQGSVQIELIFRLLLKITVDWPFHANYDCLQPARVPGKNNSCFYFVGLGLCESLGFLFCVFFAFLFVCGFHLFLARTGKKSFQDAQWLSTVLISFLFFLHLAATARSHPQLPAVLQCRGHARPRRRASTPEPRPRLKQST